MPNDIAGLRSSLIQWLQGGAMTPNIGGTQPFGGVNQQGTFGVGPTFSGGRGLPSPGNAPALASGMPLPVLKDATSSNPYTAGTGGSSAALGAALTGANGVPSVPGVTGGTPGNYGAPVGDRTGHPRDAGGVGDFNQAFYTPTYAPGSTPFNPATAEGVSLGAMPGLNHSTISNVPGAQVTSAGPASNYQDYLDPRFGGILDSFLKNGGADAFSGYSGAYASQVAPVADVGSVIDLIHSLPDIVNGQQGYFKDNILSAYTPLFQSQRDQALAQAKEQAGSLTGSGFANTLGNSINRTVVDQGAKLSDLLTQLATTELGRQVTQAGLEQNKNFQNQNTQLDVGKTNATLATQASIANAGNTAQLAASRMGNMSNLAQLLGGLAQNQAGRVDSANQFNAGQANDIAVANATQATQRAIAQGQIDASEAQSYFQGQLQQQIAQGNLTNNANQFNATQYNQAGMFNTTQNNATNQFNANAANQASQSNAGNFLNMLLSMATGGVTAGTNQYQPGASDMFGQILPFLTMLFAHRGGQQPAGGNG
jgi:hypothetical protein